MGDCRSQFVQQFDLHSPTPSASAPASWRNPDNPVLLVIIIALVAIIERPASIAVFSEQERTLSIVSGGASAIVDLIFPRHQHAPQATPFSVTLLRRRIQFSLPRPRPRPTGCAHSIASKSGSCPAFSTSASYLQTGTYVHSKSHFQCSPPPLLPPTHRHLAPRPGLYPRIHKIHITVPID